MTTEQDVERIVKHLKNATSKDHWPYIEALSAMPNKHEKAVKVLREALEKIAKRPDLPNPERDADWKNCMKWSSHEAKQALATIDEMMGE